MTPIPLPLIDAPRNGSTVLLRFKIRQYMNGQWLVIGEKWEECRWIDSQQRTGAPAHWEPWCGDPRIYTTEHISEKDVLAWLPIPQ